MTRADGAFSRLDSAPADWLARYRAITGIIAMSIKGALPQTWQNIAFAAQEFFMMTRLFARARARFTFALQQFSAFSFVGAVIIIGAMRYPACSLWKIVTEQRRRKRISRRVRTIVRYRIYADILFTAGVRRREKEKKREKVKRFFPFSLFLSSSPSLSLSLCPYAFEQKKWRKSRWKRRARSLESARPSTGVYVCVVVTHCVL